MIPQNPEKTFSCRGCGTRCAWYKTQAGKFMPMAWVKTNLHRGRWVAHTHAVCEAQKRWDAAVAAHDALVSPKALVD